MTWQEFIAVLDEVRVEIRRTKDLKSEVPERDPLVDKAITLLCRPDSVSLPKPIVMNPAEMSTIIIPADLSACVPEGDEEPVAMVVDRGEGEGRMVVPARTTFRVQREPNVVEVFDEKELGK